MRRLLAVLLVPVAISSVAPAAPVPKHLMKNQAPVSYYPTTVGAKWVYDLNGQDLVLVVSKVENDKGEKVVTVEDSGANGRHVREVMKVSEAGLARLSLGGAPFDAPLAMLQAPFRVGRTWKMKAAGVHGTQTIAAVEKLEVPAGTFEALRVDSDYTFAGQRMTDSFWYAAGVGLVKMTSGGGKEQILKSFTPGKP